MAMHFLLDRGISATPARRAGTQHAEAHAPDRLVRQLQLVSEGPVVRQHLRSVLQPLLQFVGPPHPALGAVWLRSERREGAGDGLHGEDTALRVQSFECGLERWTLDVRRQLGAGRTVALGLVAEAAPDRDQVPVRAALRDRLRVASPP